MTITYHKLSTDTQRVLQLTRANCAKTLKRRGWPIVHVRQAAEHVPTFHRMLENCCFELLSQKPVLLLMK